MAYGQVNTPGAAGAQIAQAQQAAQNALTEAQKAKTAAGNAQSTADAALEKANSAEQTANGANTTATEALDTASILSADVKTANDNASTALDTANAASKTASEAMTAAQNAQETADAVSQALTDLNSTINTVPSQYGTLSYTGSALTPRWNSYDSSKLTIGGETSATSVGTHYATFTPVDGYKWSDGTTEAKTVEWAIERATVAVPTVSSNPTYTGSAVSPTWSGYDSAKMTIGGSTSGTNAGSYSATFTPGSNYQWPDGTTTAKIVTWSISKAAGSLSISPTSMTLDISNLSKTITVTRSGDGAITATSSDTSKATVSVSGTTVTVTAKAIGSATVTVSVAAGTNHTAPSSEACAVTVDLPSTTLADNDPSVIQQAAQAGTASSYWSVGDKVGIALSGTVGLLSLSGTYYAFILGFNHNSGVEGSNSIHFQFGKTSSGVDIAFVDSEYGDSTIRTGFSASSTGNSGGWSSSHMRQDICPAFLSAMPSAWQSVIAACTKYSDNTGGGYDRASYVTPTSDKIWLLAAWEVFGKSSGGNSAEQNYQKQYDYYANGNSKIKYKHSDKTYRCHWWLRSITASGVNNFRLANYLGNEADDDAGKSYGFAPGFMVA